jgi:hypothetical protein
MTEPIRFPASGHFLAAYFHQNWMDIKIRPDWTTENADAESVVRYFIERNPPEFVKKAAEDIDQLLALGMSELLRP